MTGVRMAIAGADSVTAIELSRRKTARCTLPLAVLGSSAAKSTIRGYL